MAEGIASRRIAWNGVSFLAPGNWEMAIYKFMRGGASRIELEDEYSVRMEAEWLASGTALAMKQILARYERTSRDLTVRADRGEQIAGLPEGWFATRHIFSETVSDRKTRALKLADHDLVTAFFVSPDSRLFCFVLLHFLPGDREKPRDVMRLVASEFRHHLNEQYTPWQLFDIKFEIPRQFVPENTMFGIGAKMMSFRWKLRRFLLWYYSCPDVFLKDGVKPEEWVAGQLNGFSKIRGPVFSPGRNGEILWKRRSRFPLGHIDEITRWCFLYKARCRIDRDRNQLIVWVFSYRRSEDLEMIPPGLRF